MSESTSKSEAPPPSDVKSTEPVSEGPAYSNPSYEPDQPEVEEKPEPPIDEQPHSAWHEDDTQEEDHQKSRKPSIAWDDEAQRAEEPPKEGAHGPPEVVVDQPQSGEALQEVVVPPPGSAEQCPPGLEYLTQLDQVLVHQQVNLLQVFTSWETKNRYKIKNSLGQQVYFAAEESNICLRQCCGSIRGFTMHITDNEGKEVIRARRPFKCCADCCSCCSCFNGSCCACCGCCKSEVEVQAPLGTTAGYIRQKCSFFTPQFDILDADLQQVFHVEGPCCFCECICCVCDREFHVSTAARPQRRVGKISKQWGGLLKEHFSKADNFGISFPMDLDVRMKAVMIGAVFLIDAMYFHRSNRD